MTKEATLRYLQPEYGRFILCTWKIEGISWKILDETRKRSDETVHLHGPIPKNNIYLLYNHEVL